MRTMSEPEPTSTAIQTEVGNDGYVIVEERRCTPRVRRPLVAQVTGFREGDAVLCVIEDISEGGLFLCAPRGVGVRVGQRCELVLSCAKDVLERPACVDEPMYATVVRTRPVLSGSDSTVGAGLRFDQPIYL